MGAWEEAPGEGCCGREKPAFPWARSPAGPSDSNQHCSPLEAWGPEQVAEKDPHPSRPYF